MPHVSRFRLPPVDFGGETLGERIARIRKERGFTQVELAEKIGVVQTIISAAERDDRKLSAEMAIRFAQALGVGMDELLGQRARKAPQKARERKVLRRLEQIESLPHSQQTALLRTIDAFVRANAL